MANNATRDENRVTTLLAVRSDTFLSQVTLAADPVTHELLVKGTFSFSPSGTQDVNLIQVGGASFSLGQQLAASSLPVVLTAAQISTLTPLSTVAVTQSTSPWVVSLTSTTITGTVAVTQSGSWSVTANAGTNLNTSLLALESGGNLAAIAASASVLDDWDESDRAKVNIIVGQAGVAADVGATGATVQRVVMANNAGRTLVSKTGSAASSGNNTLVAAGTNKLKVYAFSLTTVSTTALTVKFQDGASGTDLWSYLFQAPTSINTGANLSVTPPAYLFATSAATLLNLNLSSANAVQWSVSYFDEA